LAPVLAGCKKH
jgi:hypothetical protein